MTKLFRPRQPLFSIPIVVFTGGLCSEKSRFVAEEISTQTWLWTELLQMLELTVIGSHNHVDSQALGEVRHRLVYVFLWHDFRGGIQGDF